MNRQEDGVDEYWYLAPYREERTASFQVNVRKEIWHDFGTGQGGDIFNLAGEFIGSGDFKAQARFITETWGGLAPEHKTVSRTDGNNREDLLKKESFTDVRFGPLYNRVLLRYLAERGISSDVAVPNCREVRYTLHGNGISPSDSGMSAMDTSCATGFSRPACHLRTFH